MNIFKTKAQTVNDLLPRYRNNLYVRHINRDFAVLLAILCLALGITFLSTSPSLAIAGGQPAEGDGAALLVGAPGRECSGFLYRPKIVVTAAHCIQWGGGVVTPTGELRAYPVGAKRGTQPGVAPIAVFMDDVHYIDEETKREFIDMSKDIAYLVFDRDVGQTNIVGALDFDDYLQLRRKTLELELIGYGMTSVDSNSLSVVPKRLGFVNPPMKVSPERISRYQTQIPGAMVCPGDSGGLVATRDDRGQRIAVGVLSGRDLGYCFTPHSHITTTSIIAPMNWKLLNQAEKFAGYQPTTPVKLGKTLGPLQIDLGFSTTYGSAEGKLQLEREYVIEGAWLRKEVQGTPAKQRVEYAVKVGNRWQEVGHGQLIPRDKFDIDSLIIPKSAKSVVAYSLSDIALPKTAHVYKQAESRRLIEVFAEKSGWKKTLLKAFGKSETSETFDFHTQNCPCIVVGYRMTGEKEFANEVLVPVKQTENT